LSFFSNIFGRADSKSDSALINPIQVEFHSHLIPGVDDGVETLDQSIEILKGFHAMGMRKVITTPHIMCDFYKNSKQNLHPLLQEIESKLKEENIPIEIEVAAEYMIDDGFIAKIEAGELLCFGPNKKHILVELPFMSEPVNFKEALFELQVSGFLPILAHPERYSYYAHQKDQYEELKNRGILFQVNMLSLIGYYSKPVMETAQFLIDQKMIDLVGSDTHHIRHLHLLPEVYQSKYYRKVCELELLNNQL
jgi:tyrosine-protein phosphatase YwqE